MTSLEQSGQTACDHEPELTEAHVEGKLLVHWGWSRPWKLWWETLIIMLQPASWAGLMLMSQSASMFICDGLLCTSRQLHCLLIDRTVCLTHLYKKHVLWTRTPYGYRGSAAAVTSLLCVDAFSLKPHQGQPKRRRHGVSSSESLLVSLRVKWHLPSPGQLRSEPLTKIH